MAQQELRWQIRTEGREGFELGLDTVTPVSFRVTRARGPGKALYALTLPEPITQAYKDWLSANRGKRIIASVAELKAKILGMQPMPA